MGVVPSGIGRMFRASSPSLEALKRATVAVAVFARILDALSASRRAVASMRSHGVARTETLLVNFLHQIILLRALVHVCLCVS